MIQQVPAILWSTDADLRFTASVGGALKDLGLEPDQVVGMSLFEFFRTGDSEFPPIAAHRHALEGRPTDYDLEWSGRTFRSHVEPLTDEAGEIIGVVGVSTDITEHKRMENALRERQARHRLITDTASDAIIRIDEDSLIRFVNPAIEKIFGYTQDELLGKSITMLMPERLRDRHRASLRRHLDTGERHIPWDGVELPALHKDGHEIPVEVSFGESVTDGARSFTGVIRDITARKQAESELARTMEELRRSDEQRRRLLARLVEAQEEERRRIASDIHDDSIQILTALGLRLETLRRYIKEEEPASMIGQLRETVGLAISRLRHLMFELRPPALDREGLVTALKALLEQVAGSTDVEYRLDSDIGAEPPQEIRIMIYRIAQEAISNVRKHSAARTLHVSVGKRDGGYLVGIADDGLGFSPDEPDTFVPGHLGIATMRERAELAGGWLRVESGPGQGTSVEFWIPAEPQDPAEPGPGQPDA